MTQRLVATVIVFMLLATIPVVARSQVISTSEALALEDTAKARETVHEYLSRDDVEAELVSLGVAPDLARLRVASLSDHEVVELAGRIHEAPAGGNLLAVIGVTFVVLLILELVGVIDIFKSF